MASNMAFGNQLNGPTVLGGSGGNYESFAYDGYNAKMLVAEA